MFFFKKVCKHPFDSLAVLKDSSTECNKDYKVVTYYFHCVDCGEDVNLRYVKYIDDSWFKRKEEKE